MPRQASVLYMLTCLSLLVAGVSESWNDLLGVASLEWTKTCG